MNTYIPPTGTIQILTGLNLNPNQEDTLYFENTATRDAYMNNFVSRQYTNQSYSRPSKGVVRILDTIGIIYESSYMRFINGDAFEGATTNHWIYAFIINIEYVNNNTCDIYYIIDDLITWLPNGGLRECFVEREIPETDFLYENLMPENLETGEYTTTDEETVDFAGDLSVVIISTKKYDGSIWESYTDVPIDQILNPGESSCFVNGLLSPLHFTVFPANTISDTQRIYNWVKEYMNEGQADNIVSIQYMPTLCAKRINNQDYEKLTWETPRPISLDGYKPKNNKLYTYPYCLLTVSNNNGQVAEYRYENFPIINEQYVKFEISGTAFGSPALFCYPKNYAGQVDNYDAGIALTNFPTIPWANDAYQAYLAQNRASLTTGILCSTVSALSKGFSSFSGSQIRNATGNATQFAATSQLTSIAGQAASMAGMAGMVGAGIGTAVEIGTSIAQAMAKIEDAKAIPNTVHGQTQIDGLNLAIRRVQYDFDCRTIKAEMARAIDNYFSMYGYTQHKVKIPNISSRPKWNYTKTQGCIVVGDMPASSRQNICALFDRGIRFWKQSSDIGHFDRDNLP